VQATAVRRSHSSCYYYQYTGDNVTQTNQGHTYCALSYCGCYCRGCERSDITKHVLVHNQPQHTCDICGKSFRHI